MTNKFMQTENNNSRENNFRIYKSLPKFAFGIAVLMMMFLMTAADAHAQRNQQQSVCEKYGFSDTTVDLEGIWKLTFTGGSTDYETFMVIKKQNGISLTRYYDASVKRTRRISQVHTVCQSKGGIIILGFQPTDIDTKQTGTDLTYQADNFIFILGANDKISAFNVDDGGNKMEVDIEFLEELPRDVKIK